MFRAGSTIRNAITGELYIVLQCFKSGTLVASIQDNRTLVDPKIILKREYGNYEDDQKLKKNDGDTHWSKIEIA